MASNTINFTKTELLKIVPPTSGRIQYNDSKITGLQLRVSSTGVKTFSVYRWGKTSNKPERITIGRFPDVSVEAARSKAEEIIATFALGGDPGEAKRKARLEMTFKNLFEIYLERHAKPHKRTWKGDQSMFELYLSNDLHGLNFAKMKITAIDRSLISQLHSKIGKTHPTTANRIVALISSIYGRAMDWNLFTQINPATRIKKYKEVSRERFLQTDELPRFFEALGQEPSASIRGFFLMCLLTGARRGNVMSMRWKDIDIATRTWRIPGEQSKNGLAIQVVLGEEAIAILAECKIDNASEWVFLNRSNNNHIAEPKYAWQRLLDADELNQLRLRLDAFGKPFKPLPNDTLITMLERARLLAQRYKIDTTGSRMQDLRPHDLRRTLGSYQAITGSSLPIIGKSLGHKSQAATQIYARLDLDPVRNSVKKATEAMYAAARISTQVKAKE